MAEEFPKPVVDNNSLAITRLEKMIADQRDTLEKIYSDVRRTRRYIALGKIISFIYLIVILAPLVFAYFYLPKLIQNFITPYQSLLNVDSSVDISSSNQNHINSQLLEDIMKELGH